MKSVKVLLVSGAMAWATVAGAATTGSAGQSAPFSTYQAGLVVNQVLTVQGNYPQRYLTAPGQNAIAYDDTLASITMFAGSFAPRGSYAAQGQVMPIAQNTALFSLLGANYGGDGRSTFALPNAQGRVLTGAGYTSALTGHGVGDQYGTATTQLSTANLPAHSHAVVGGEPTAPAGGGQPFATVSPSLAITYLINTEGTYPLPDSRSSGDGFLGQVTAFAGNFEPVGALKADGRLLNISDYSALYQVIGTTYGGDGNTNFALPDLTGRAAVGVDRTGLNGTVVSLGQAFGGESTTLTEAQMPLHVHSLPDGTFTAPDGGGQPVGIDGPSLGLNYIINVAGGIYPSRNLVSGIGANLTFDSSATLGEISLFAGDYAPGGWAIANGQLLPIAQNQALFSLLGTTYGGDGQVTFALPDFRGRTAYGVSTSDPQFQLGRTVGANSLALSVNNLPGHVHVVADPVVIEPAAAVPEPASWAMMLGGFGLLGCAMRRRRTSITFG